mgnify:CR=1 FL=1
MISNLTKSTSSLLLLALVAIYAWAPLPLGSNRDWSLTLLANLLLLHGVCTLLCVALKLSPLTSALKKAWPLLALLLAVQFWVGVQWMTNISLYHPPTRAALHLGCGLSAAAFSVLALLETRAQLRFFVGALFIIGLIQGLFAGIALLSGIEQIGLLDKVFRGDRATGTYVNPNHLAGLMEMTLGLGVGLVLTGISHRRASNRWSDRLRGLVTLLMSPVLRVRLWMVLLVVVLVMTRSRTGNVAFFVALVAGGALWFIMRKEFSRKALVLFISFVLIDVIIVADYFGLDKLIDRFEQSVANTAQKGSDGTMPAVMRSRLDPGRIVAAEDTLRMWQDNFVTGTGAGTFPYVYNFGDRRGSAPYRSNEKLTFRYAHNDYLEIGAEYGAIGFTLMAAAVLVSAYQGLIAIRRRRGQSMPALSLGLIIGILSLLIHGVADGNLQIPANALWFVTFLTLCWVARYMGKTGAKAPADADTSLSAETFTKSFRAS